MKNILAKFYIVIWMMLLLAVGIYYVALAPKEATYSETENRNLAAMPELTINNLLTGAFSGEIEEYFLDRFPKRDIIIGATNKVQGVMSFASYKEYLLIAEDSTDPLDSDDYVDSIEGLLGQLNTSQPSDDNSSSDEEQTDKEDMTIEEPTTEELTTEEPTTEEPKEYPPIEEKVPANIEDFPANLGVYMETDGGKKGLSYYKRNNVLAVTAVLNKYASLLPEDGKLMFTVVPQSSRANRFVDASDKVAFYADWDDVVNGMGANNVYAFDSAEIMSGAMMADEYVYFRTDMHWTPYGSYLLYKEMVTRAGLEPCDYDSDFTHQLETPFRGTYYRDKPSAYENVTPDDLDILTPSCPLEWRRITSKDKYKLIDFINMKAKKNDRYTVYLSGPAGPWTYAECDNGKEENCLVIMDSFGLGYLPFLTANYKQVHYYDPRYFDKGKVGYSVSEMMELYNIQDIYVVVGDLHSFDSSFLLSYANDQLGK